MLSFQPAVVLGKLSPSPPTARAAMLNNTTPILTGIHCELAFEPKEQVSSDWSGKIYNLATANNCVFHHKEKASLPQDKAGTQRGRGKAGRAGSFPVLARLLPWAPAPSGPGCDLNSRRMLWLSDKLLFLLKLIYIRFVALVTQTSS